MRDVQKAERQQLDERQKMRAVAEAKVRNERLRSGVMGLWDRLTGRRGETIRQNEAEALRSVRRYRGERGDLVADQLKDRRALQRDIVDVRRAHAAEVSELHRDLAVQREARGRESERTASSFNRAATSLRRTERPRSG